MPAWLAAALSGPVLLLGALPVANHPGDDQATPPAVRHAFDDLDLPAESPGSALFNDPFGSEADSTRWSGTSTRRSTAPAGARRSGSRRTPSRCRRPPRRCCARTAAASTCRSWPTTTRRPGSRSATWPTSSARTRTGAASCRSASPLPGDDRQPARQVRDDLPERPGRRRGDGRVDELHGVRRGAAVAGPLHGRRGLRPLRPVRAAVQADGARRAAGHRSTCRPRGRASSRTWHRGTRPRPTRWSAGSARSSAGGPPEAPGRTAAPWCGSRCTPGTASGASASPGR